MKKLKRLDLRRAGSIARKEVFHILRDPFTLVLALGLPVLLVTIFGTAIEFNVKDIRLSVVDYDRTQTSRTMAELFSSSGYFILQPATSTAAAVRDLDADRSRAALIVEPGFERDLVAGRPASAQVLLDGSDNSTAGVVAGYLAGIQAAAARRLSDGQRTAPTLDLRTRYLFNPELNSKWFVIPGLAVVVVAILSVLLTALTIAREWENGSMELLLSTPVRPLEIIAGKIAPYTVLGLASIAFIYLSSRLIFSVPFVGSHLLFSLGSLMFLAAYLAQGILISVVTRKQQLSMQIAMLTGLLPSLLLSGFIFPIENMPLFFRILTALLPARWFMEISRGLFLKGAGLSELAAPFLALLTLDLVLIGLATVRFKKDVEP